MEVFVFLSREKHTMEKTRAHEKQHSTSQSPEKERNGGRPGDKFRKAIFSLIALVVFLGLCVGIVLLIVTGGGEDHVSFVPEDITIVKISPPDQSAVIKTSEGALHIIRVGDSPPGLGRVVEIVEGRIVIAAQGVEGDEEIIISLVDGKQSMVRIRQVGETEPLFSTRQAVE
jgi:hypothetical protein